MSKKLQFLQRYILPFILVLGIVSPSILQAGLTAVPEVEFQTTSFSIQENNTTATAVIVLSEPATNTVTASYEVVEKDATNGTDFSCSDGDVVFNPGETVKTISILINEDNINEGTESLRLKLKTAINATINTLKQDFTCSILDDDILVRFTTLSSNKFEGAPPGVMVEAASIPSFDITVNFSIETSSTAETGSDYQLLGASFVTIPANAKNTTIDNTILKIINDNIDEENETIVLKIISVTNGQIDLSNDFHTLYIIDNDVEPSVQVLIANQENAEPIADPSITIGVYDNSNNLITSGKPIDLTFSLQGTATEGVDYSVTSKTITIPAGSSTFDLPISIINDNLLEPDENIVITLTDAVNATVGVLTTQTYTIKNDDAAAQLNFTQTTSQVGEGNKATLTVELSTVLPVDITGTYSFGGTATNTDFFDISDLPALSDNTFTIPAGATTATIVLDIIADGITEGNETIIIQLDNATNASIGSNNNHTLIVPNADLAIGFASNAIATAEGNTNSNNLWVPLVLAGTASHDIIVDYSILLSSTATGADYSDPLLGSITIPANSNADYLKSALYFIINEENIYENDETIEVAITNVSGAKVGAIASTTITITNDDTFPTLSFIASAGAAAEGNTNNIISLLARLSNPTDLGIVTADLSGTVTDADGNDYSIPSSIAIPKGSAEATIPITITGDDVYEADQDFTISLLNLANATLGTKPTYTHTITNDDALPTLSFDVATIVIDEGNTGTTDITVTVNASNTNEAADMTADFIISNLTTEANDYIPANSLIIPQGATHASVTFSINGDNIYETDEAFSLQLTNLANCTAALNTSTNVTIKNDDTEPTVSLTIASNDGNELNTGSEDKTVTVSLSNPTEMGTVTGNFVITGNAENTDYNLPLSFSIAEGTISQSYALSILGDETFETDEVIHITANTISHATLSSTNNNVSYTIINDDSLPEISFAVSSHSVVETESNHTTTITVLLSNPTEIGDVSATITTSSTTIEASDYSIPASLLIPTGQTSATFNFEVIGDKLYEKDETVELELTSLHNTVNGSIIKQSFTIEDDDLPPVVSFTTNYTKVSEGTANTTITLLKTGLTEFNTIVDLTVGGTAIKQPNADYDHDLSDTQIIFLPNETEQQITISITNDALVEIVKLIDLNITAANADNTIGAISNHIIELADNDYYGFTGPGGVGNKLTNKLWMKADNISGIFSGEVLTRWEDASGNNNYADGLGSGKPKYLRNQLGLQPALIFDGVDDYLGGSANFDMSADGGSTIFFIAKNEENDASHRNSGLFIGNTAGNDSEYRHYGLSYRPEVSIANNSYSIFDNVMTTGNWNLAMYQNSTADQLDNFSCYINGQDKGIFSQDNEQEVPQTQPDIYIIGSEQSGGNFNANKYFEGSLAEVVVYNYDINEAQRIIVENYLAAKYYTAISLPANSDKYPYDPTHGNDVAGIGFIDEQNFHTGAESGKILSVKNANDLTNGFMFWGHDNASVDQWTDNETFGGLLRIAREWRFTDPNNVGKADITIDTTLFTARPAGFDFLLIVDNDGDFTGGYTTYKLESEGNDQFYSVNDIDIPDGAYITIGILRPEVQFVTDKIYEFENKNAQIEINLNYIPQQDVVLTYTVNSSNATSNDFTLANGTITVPQGQSSIMLSAPINDDILLEDDESFTITLTNTSFGYIGTINAHTYTILDNDRAIKVQFSQTNNTINESETVLNTKVALNNQTINNVYVDYILKSGDAEQGSDLTFTTGTLHFSPGETEKEISINIHDDSEYEPDETIEIALINPKNANLFTNLTHTITIVDDESAPTVTFEADNMSGMESYSPILIPLTLDYPSYQPITLDIKTTDVTAGGSDYTISVPSLTIPAGDTSAVVALTIFSDNDEESNETFSFEIINQTGAVLGTNTKVDYTILDDDGLGYYGPGGIGNLDDQIASWLKAEELLEANGSRIETFSDLSNNNIVAYQTNDSYKPVLKDNAWNGNAVLEFNPNNLISTPIDQLSYEHLKIKDNDRFNTYSGAQTKRTILVAFRTGSNITTRQVVYEEGLHLRGLNFYIKDGILHIGGWNNPNDDKGVTTPWKYRSVQYPIEPNTPYFATLVFDFDEQCLQDFEDGIIPDISQCGGVQGTLNEQINRITGGGKLFTHTGDIGLGGSPDGACFEDGCFTNLKAESSFSGHIAEFMSSNAVYNLAQIRIVQNHFASSYDIVLPETHTLYSHIDQPYNVIGIGQENSTNFHNISQGKGIVKIENPDNMEDKEYLLIGDDNTSINAWLTTNVPNNDPYIKRLERTWRVDKTGDCGNITFSVDTTQLPSKSLGFTDFILIKDSDNDFTNSQEIFVLERDGSKFNSIEKINFNDGDFFTIGIIRPSVNLVQVSGESFEYDGATTLTAKLNYPFKHEVTVDYRFNSITATENQDYIDLVNTITFMSGESEKEFSFDLINDTNIEYDETFEVELIAPSTGLYLGNKTVYTHTVHDDDHPRVISFSTNTAEITVDESIGNITMEVSVDASQIDAVNTTTVDYLIQSTSTAIGGATEDFILSNGTFTIPAGSQSNSITFPIVDDVFDEEDIETIEIILSNPQNGSISTNNTFTVKIQDNDDVPELKYSTTSGAFDESVTAIYISTELSAASKRDITVDYAVTGGNADNNWVDFDLNNSTLTIPAGETSAIIPLFVYDDISIENTETIEITLSNPTNATLTNSLYTYSILDNDKSGYTGPGGVGNNKQYRFWYKEENVTVTNGKVTKVLDISGNGLDSKTTTREPNLVNINDHKGIYFGGNDRIDWDNSVHINDQSYSSKTIAVSFKTNNDVSARQVLWGQGSDDEGLNIYISNGYVYAGAYSTVNNKVKGKVFARSNSLNTHTKYQLLFEMDRSNGTYTLFVNGEQTDQEDCGITSPLTPHSNASMGYNSERRRFHNTTTSNNSYFKGDIMEVVYFNTILNTTQKQLVYNYFASEYGIPFNDPNNDRYQYQDEAYKKGLIGIGMEDIDNLHTASLGRGIIKLFEPGNFNDNEIITVAHDNAAIDTWQTSDIPGAHVKRLAREWKADVNGDFTFSLGVDATQIPAIPSNFDNYALMVESNSDGDFTTLNAGETVSYYSLVETDGDFKFAENVTMKAGDIFTITVAKNASFTNGIWDSTATWASRVVPTEIDKAYISENHTVEITRNVEVKELEIANGATLKLNGHNLTLTEGSISVLGTGTLDMGGGTIIYAGSNGQCISGDLEYNNLVISGAGTKILCNNIVVNGNISIENSELDVNTANNYSIEVKGNWESNGDLFYRNGKVKFTGDANQTILHTSSSGESFNSIEIDKPSGQVNLLTPLTIDNSIILTQGNLAMNSKDITINRKDQDGIIGGSENSYIETYDPAYGNADIIWNIDNSVIGDGNDFLFPVGDTSHYTPFTFKLDNGNMLSSNAEINFSMVPLRHPALGITETYLERYWSLSVYGLSGTSIDYDITFQYHDDDIKSSDLVLYPEARMGIGKYSGGVWTQPDTLSGEDSTKNIATNIFTWSNIKTFSDYTAGTGSETAPLPIELVEFNGKLVNEEVILNWSTSSEVDNDYFILERSFDGINFRQLGKIEGAGTISTLQNYSFTDKAPAPGINHYRLRQVDYNGSSTTFPILTINYNIEDYDFITQMMAYPNPHIDGALNVALEGVQENKTVTIEVYDISGNLLLSQETTANNDGALITTIDEAASLKPGMYTIVAKTEMTIQYTQLLKQ